MKNKFLEEIEEQPKALTRTFQHYLTSEGKDALKRIYELWNSGQYEIIIFTGMGSSYFISQAAATMLASDSIPAFAVNAGEVLHSQFPVLNKKTLLVCISQSGESYEVVQLLQKISSLITVIGITNESSSKLAQQSDYVLLCKAGKELMTSTKTFVTTYLVVYILTQCLKGKSIDQLLEEEITQEVERLISSRNDYIRQCLNFLGDVPFVQLIGRGTDYASVAQSALMFMEATKTPASALLGGEFRHGPLEMVSETFVGIVFAHTLSVTYSQSIKLIQDVVRFGGKIILISDGKSGIENFNLQEIIIGCKEPDLFAIPSIIPVQLIVNAWAEEKWLVPGDFTHGSKVTSIE